MASVNDWRERTRLDATSAGDGRQALHPTRLLHYDLTAGSVTVQAVADQLPAAARVRSVQKALGGALAPLASGLLIGAHEHGDGALLQLTIYTASGASGARRLAPWWRGAPRTGRSVVCQVEKLVQSSRSRARPIWWL